MADEGIVTFCVIDDGMICGVTADNGISGGISTAGCATGAAVVVVTDGEDDVVGGIHSLIGLVSFTGNSN